MGSRPEQRKEGGGGPHVKTIQNCNIAIDGIWQFANIGIVLVGDLLQIPPVKAVYIFQPPKYEKSLVLHNLVEHEGKIYRPQKGPLF